MANFPSVISTFNIVAATDRLNNPSHSALHNSVSSVLTQVQTIIGVDGASSLLGTIIGDLRSPASKGGGHVQGAAFGGTGQTTYTKGDLLIASSASVLTKLAVGVDGRALIANSSVATGVQWGTFPTPVVRVYSTVSVLTWTKPAGLSYVVVEVQAGGGAGANGADLGATGIGGGGGGAGGYSKSIIQASTLGTTETVTIGAAAANSSFGAHATASTGSAGSVQAGGAGGIGTAGDIKLEGGDGCGAGSGASKGGAGGEGGTAHLGGGGKGGAGVTDWAGGAGNLYGGGGGGGGGADDGAGSGAAGAQGIVIVTEY